MIYSLCIQNSHQHVTVALCRDNLILHERTLPNQHTSAQLIPTIHEILSDATLDLHSCSYIAATQGPAPFTSLRAVLATVNGILAGAGTALIGIDSLRLLVAHEQKESADYTIALLDAFNKELYYAIRNNNTHVIQTGYGTVAAVLEIIDATIDTQRTLIVGHGAYLYRHDIEGRLGQRVAYPSNVIMFPSLQEVVSQGWKEWQNNKAAATPLLPLYLKRHQAELLP
jgi:tRNA threonylcarbamoyladenosine biosynthesis protein TsaB